MQFRESVAGHWNMQLKFMEDCFRDIHTFGMGYRKAKGYGRAGFDAQKHHHSIKSGLKRIQDCTSDAVAPIK